MEQPKLQHIPQVPGVYLFRDKKENVLYIWKAKNLQKRVSQYFSQGSVRKQDMIQKADHIEFIQAQTESEALYLEDNLIKQYHPEFNNLLKADNSYTYIKITNHPFPEVFLTKRKIQDWSTYIGPKHNTMELKKLLQYFRQILQRRGCKIAQFKQGKVCSDYYFGLCKGRCAMDLDAIQAQKDMQYIMNFFKWNTDPVEKEIREKITDAIEKQHFERAAKLRDMLLHMEQFTEKQTAVLSQPLSWHIAEIREVWNRRVYVVLYLYQWKIIDVIRQKIPKDDYEKDSLLVVLNNEYWNFEEKYDMYLAMSKSPKKEDRQELKKFIDRCFESFIATNAFQEWTLLNDLLKTLQERYDLSVFPYRIECLDISHLSGWWASGGLSCVVWGIKYPHGYRKYKIAEDHAGDDYASLEEVVLRRFSYDQEFLNLPNIFVLDWWKWQLQTIKRCLEKNPEIANRCEHIQFVSLWKWEARDKNRIWKQKKGEIISEKLYVLDHWSIKETPFIYDAADQILLHLRDEAHRFANAYRTKQMSQEFTEKPKKK